MKKSKLVFTQELTVYAQEFLKKNYNMTLDIPIEINARLSSTMGYLRVGYQTGSPKAVKLSLSKRMIEYNPLEVTLDTLRHELTHYACVKMGKPYHDGDAYFENELKKNQTSSTKTGGINQPLNVYTCGCSQWKTRSRTYDNKYMCSKCKSMIEFSHVEEPPRLIKLV